MRTLLNVIWLVFGGLWLALGYFFLGLLACIFIITIPFGIASMRMAAYALWPFGRTIERMQAEFGTTPGAFASGDWRCYRYRTNTTVVPLRNFVI